MPDELLDNVYEIKKGALFTLQPFRIRMSHFEMNNIKNISVTQCEPEQQKKHSFKYTSLCKRMAEGNENDRKKRMQHELRSLYIISVLSVTWDTLPLASHFRFFFCEFFDSICVCECVCHITISICSLTHPIQLMQGISIEFVCCQWNRYTTVELLKATFYHKSGNKLLLLQLSNATEMPYRSRILFEIRIYLY